MNKLFAVLLFFFFFALSVFSQTPSMPLPHQSPSQPRILLEDGSIVGKDNPMPVDADVNLGSITVDVFPVYADDAGNPVTATIDIEHRAVVNLGSETVGLKTAIEAVKAAVEAISVTVDTSALEAAQALTTAAVDKVESAVAKVEPVVDDIALFVKPANIVATQTVSLLANTSAVITSTLPIDSPRKFIEIVAMDNTKEFWLDYGGEAVINACRRVYGGVYIELRGGATSINIIASEAIDLYVTEGGLE
jgi:hypothetical protein